MVSAVGMISGGHFNPAVTLGFLVTRRIAPVLAVAYWLAQFGAAALAAVLLRGSCRRPQRGTHLGAPARQRADQPGKGVMVEAVLTFFLVWVVFATAVDPRGTFKQIAGLAIGLTITFDALMGVGLTGGAMNPSRAFGPQLVASTGRTSGSGTSVRSPAVRSRRSSTRRSTSAARRNRWRPPETGVEEIAPVLPHPNRPSARFRARCCSRSRPGIRSGWRHRRGFHRLRPRLVVRLPAA